MFCHNKCDYIQPAYVPLYQILLHVKRFTGTICTKGSQVLTRGVQWGYPLLSP